MKNIIFIIIMLSVCLFGQTPKMVKSNVGTLNFTTTGVKSVTVYPWSFDQLYQNNIPWEGQWNLHVKVDSLSGSTVGNFDIYYKRGDWNFQIEDMVSDTLVTAWDVVDNGFKQFDIHQNMPVHSIIVYVSRTSGDANVNVDLTQIFTFWDK